MLRSTEIKTILTQHNQHPRFYVSTKSTKSILVRWQIEHSLQIDVVNHQTMHVQRIEPQIVLETQHRSQIEINDARHPIWCFRFNVKAKGQSYNHGGTGYHLDV